MSQFIKLQELYYAGSHGLDIVGPTTTMDGNRWRKSWRTNPRSGRLDVMDRVTKELIERCEDIPGTNIEHNMFCVSAHYRAVSEEMRPRVEKIVGRDLERERSVSSRHDGKMVWEVRPRVAWDKGKALTYLRNALLKELEGQGFTSDQVYTIYIGTRHGRGRVHGD